MKKFKSSPPIAFGAGEVECRIDFFDDEIESLRFFSTENQRSGEKVDVIQILPAREVPLDEDAIATFRSKSWKGSAAGRVLEELVVTAFGPDVATTNAVYRAGDGRASRQSQTWAQLPEGWRIVAAHVSAAP